MILDMFGLMGAYAAGSSREVAMSAYILVLVVLVCSYVSAHVLLYGLTAEASAPEAPVLVERARKYLLIFATLAATVAYQAGLSTPGGFWLGSQAGDHLAGDPMLRGKYPYRFMVFFYFNTTAFVASLVTIILLMSKTVSRHGFRSSALWVCVGATMVGLTGAFASGSCRSFKTSIYVVALVVAVLLYIAIQAMVFVCEPVKNWLHQAGQTLQRCLKSDELEQQNQQQITLSNQGNGDAYLLLKKSRMYLLLLGILAASVTYQAGLNPPGGFWQSDGTDGHRHYLAGDPAAMILDLFGLIGAYAAGSCRQASKSVYVSVLVLPVFLYVGVHVLVFMLDVSPTWATWRERVREKLEQCVPGWLKNLLELEEHVEEEEEEWKLEKRRKLLLLVAILAASLTYEAGMNPPGGFWQEGKSGHVGDPVLNDNYRRRYLAFFFCNATAFVASLAIIMLLVNRKLSAGGIRSYALRVCVILDLVGLMGAFAAGSCRNVKTSIYVFVLVFAVLLCIAFQVALVVSESLRRLVESLLAHLVPLEDDAGAPRRPPGGRRLPSGDEPAGRPLGREPGQRPHPRRPRSSGQLSASLQGLLLLQRDLLHGVAGDNGVAADREGEQHPAGAAGAARRHDTGPVWPHGRLRRRELQEGDDVCVHLGIGHRCLCIHCCSGCGVHWRGEMDEEDHGQAGGEAHTLLLP
uniref:PGG domain-containing protein n=1 Tax=Oryza brachyantha TaxID=4533 RepID=J3N5Y6_ORYBR